MGVLFRFMCRSCGRPSHRRAGLEERVQPICYRCLPSPQEEKAPATPTVALATYRSFEEIHDLQSPIEKKMTQKPNKLVDGARVVWAAVVIAAVVSFAMWSVYYVFMEMIK